MPLRAVHARHRSNTVAADREWRTHLVHELTDAGLAALRVDDRLGKQCRLAREARRHALFEPVRTASSARAPAVPRPAQSSWRWMRLRKSSSSTASRSTEDGVFPCLGGRLPRGIGHTQRAGGTVLHISAHRGMRFAQRVARSVDQRIDQTMSDAATASMLRPPRIKSSASRTPSAPFRSASKRGRRCVPP